MWQWTMTSKWIIEHLNRIKYYNHNIYVSKLTLPFETNSKIRELKIIDNKRTKKQNKSYLERFILEQRQQKDKNTTQI